MEKDIIHKVCERFGLTEKQIKGSARTRDLVVARALVVNLLRLKGVTYQKIGVLLDKNHASLINQSKRHYLYMGNQEYSENKLYKTSFLEMSGVPYLEKSNDNVQILEIDLQIIQAKIALHKLEEKKAILMSQNS